MQEFAKDSFHLLAAVYTPVKSMDFYTLYRDTIEE
jgi:hypothetical protein